MISIKTTNFPLAFDRINAFAPLAFVLQLVAFWAVWRWIAIRVWTSNEEVWRLVSFAAAIFFCFFWRNRATEFAENLPSDGTRRSIFAAAFLTFIYAVSFAYDAPPLLRAIPAMAALTAVLSRWRFGTGFHVGLFALLLLGLPVVASLNFYLGYPLRVAVGEAVEFILRLQGLDVWREGVCLHFGGRSLWIDAPCGGIKMLWFGSFLAAALACFYRLGNWKTLAALALAFAAVLIGNVLRTAALFYTEGEIIRAPAAAHEGIGVFAFALTAAAVVFIVKWLESFKWQKYFS